MASPNPIDRLLTAITTASIPECDVWTDDAVVDATVPGWRFTLVGPDAIRSEYARWFADPAELAEVRRWAIDDGEVVEYVVTWSEHGVPHAAHHIHVCELSDDEPPRIVADTVMCGGRWPASLLAEMEAARLANR